ncbi:MAG: FAD-binding oxidoreductase [Neomegalonema sp.]|nr:FAD-binding oxidoreductase [Neomegalonema sp.]
MSGFLDANGPLATYPDSAYAASTPIPPLRASLQGKHETDIAIIGGGFAGLSAALHLAQAGLRVVLLEAHRIGWGASGRNGGQLGSLPRADMGWYERAMGKEDARKIAALAQSANDLVRALIDKHEIACDLRDGVLNTLHRPRFVALAQREVEHYNRDYDAGLSWHDAAQTAALTGSQAYHGALLETRAAHLNPLALCFGLAQAAQSAGAQLYERARVLSLDGTSGEIRTEKGQLRADRILLAVNGYHDGIEPRSAERVFPINNFILATEPLGAAFPEILPTGLAVADSRFVINYFRLSADRRMLWGGGESARQRFPSDIGSMVRKHMLAHYPQLEGAAITHAWGGTLGITGPRAPIFLRPAPKLLSIGGWSGSGIHMGVMGGKIAADAIIGTADAFDLLARVPVPPLPGGQTLRAPMLRAALTWYGLLDRL